MANYLGENLDTLFNKMEDFVSAKTIVGEAITIGDVVLLPLIEVSVGVGAAASQAKSDQEKGAGGLGARIIPSAVLAIHNGNVQLINVKNQDAVNKLIDMAPGVVSKLNFGSFFHKGKEEEKEEPKEEVKFEETVVVEE